MRKAIALSLALFLVGIWSLAQAQSPQVRQMLLLGAGKQAGGASGCVAPNLTSNWFWTDAVHSYTEGSGTPTTLITTDGTTIGSQFDLGGGGHHLYGGTVGPTYKTNILNALPSSRYSAVGLTSMATASAPTGNNASIYIVANQTAVFQPYDGLISNGPSDLSPRFAILTNNSGFLGPFNGGYGASPAFSANTYHLIAVTIDNTGSFPTVIQLDNNAANIANAAGGGSLGNTNVGVFFNGIWNGDIIEIIFNLAVQPLSTGAGLCNRQYLNSRYNLGLGI